MGNIGTGKSTYCKNNFVNEEIIICPDDWNLSISELQKKMFIEIEKGLLENKIVVVDGVNLTKKNREVYIYLARNAKCKVVFIDFGPGDIKTLTRKINNYEETTEKEWKEIHEENFRKYEKPNVNEGFKIVPVEIKTMYCC